MSTLLFSKTPSVTVLDNRGLTVRNIAYHCHPDTPSVTDERITRHQYNAAGFPSQSADPRLHEAGLANFTFLTDLAGSVLQTVSADAGTTATLNDAGGRPYMAVSNIRTADDDTEDRSQAVTRSWQYEDAPLPGRPLSVTETTADGSVRITERFVYASNTGAEKALNLAGKCISHYDTAGRVQTDSIALTGVPLAVTRRLLKDADNPDTVADWQGADSSAWNNLLAGEAYTTLTTADATGTVLTATDAKGNQQRVAYDVAGLLSGSWLTLKGGKEQTIIASLTYSAAGQKLREEHGNGVVTTYTYEAETQRLTGIKTERPTGHASGAKVLQDLRYEYDPVGNVLKISNDAEETRFWRNQKVVPENTYVYDSLYQLVSTAGREMANVGQQGSNLPSATVPFLTDNSAYTNYTRTYTYDTAGNLTQVRHSAQAPGSGYTTNITVSDRSNRSVLSTLTENAADVDALFTAGGQQKQLLPGQTLVWTPRNELLKVTPVVREGDADDRESYRYDGSSQRILKVSAQKTGNSTQSQRVLYLPGLELRRATNSSTETENLQVITVGEAGHAQVRVLCWESGRPADISNNQLRYSYDNLIGSSGLEVDGEGNLISLEEYYPYGGTAVWAARSAVEADYKTVRYSGKERDATGLYYYGYRYYQPWAGRWLSADPAGTVDGMNLFRMCRNNPVMLRDDDGRVPGFLDKLSRGLNAVTKSLWGSGKVVGQLDPEAPPEYSSGSEPFLIVVSLSADDNPAPVSEYKSVSKYKSEYKSEYKSVDVGLFKKKPTINDDYNSGSPRQFIGFNLLQGKSTGYFGPNRNFRKFIHKLNETHYYRGDSRPPKKIFESGFQSRHASANVGDHTTENFPSQFISVSREFGTAFDYAGPNGGEVDEFGVPYKFGFVYKMRNNRAIFDNPNYTTAMVANPENNFPSGGAHYDEYLVINEIPVEDIESVSIFDENKNFVQELMNPSFDPNRGCGRPLIASLDYYARRGSF
jgi:insecticidal toxin complex protein TccC